MFLCRMSNFVKLFFISTMQSHQLPGFRSGPVVMKFFHAELN